MHYMHWWDIRYHNFLAYYISGGHNTFWVPAANAHSLYTSNKKERLPLQKRAMQPILGLCTSQAMRINIQ
jgi:GMP synthase-like glutamine amidotransferase